jgi:hypothetical protein
MMNPLADRPASRLVALFSLIALIVILTQIHWALWYYFDVEFDAQKVLAEVATGGVVGAIYGFLPALNRRYLQRKTHDIVASELTLKALVTILALIFLIGLGFNRTKINWPAGQADIEIDGQKLRSENWSESATNTKSTYGLAFQTRDLQVGDSAQLIRFRPFVPLTYEVPEAAVFSSRPEYQKIVRLLALSFFQSTENRFLSEASDQFNSDTAKKFADLSSVLAILKLCFGGSDSGRSADILVETFRQERSAS